MVCNTHMFERSSASTERWARRASRASDCKAPRWWIVHHSISRDIPGAVSRPTLALVYEITDATSSGSCPARTSMCCTTSSPARPPADDQFSVDDDRRKMMAGLATTLPEEEESRLSFDGPAGGDGRRWPWSPPLPTSKNQARGPRRARFRGDRPETGAP